MGVRGSSPLLLCRQWSPQATLPQCTPNNFYTWLKRRKGKWRKRKKKEEKGGEEKEREVGRPSTPNLHLRFATWHKQTKAIPFFCSLTTLYAQLLYFPKIRRKKMIHSGLPLIEVMLLLLLQLTITELRWGITVLLFLHTPWFSSLRDNGLIPHLRTISLLAPSASYRKMA